MNLDLTRKLFRWQKNGYEINASIFKNTFLSMANININKILQICYLYLRKSPTLGIVKMTGIQSEAVLACCQHLRELVSYNLELSDIKIGGPGIIVEIDESKLDKRKYHRVIWLKPYGL